MFQWFPTCVVRWKELNELLFSKIGPIEAEQKPVEQVKSTRIEYFLKVRVLHDIAENRVSSSTE